MGRIQTKPYRPVYLFPGRRILSTRFLSHCQIDLGPSNLRVEAECLVHFFDGPLMFAQGVISGASVVVGRKGLKIQLNGLGVIFDRL